MKIPAIKMPAPGIAVEKSGFTYCNAAGLSEAVTAPSSSSSAWKFWGVEVSVSAESLKLLVWHSD